MRTEIERQGVHGGDIRLEIRRIMARERLGRQPRPLIRRFGLRLELSHVSIVRPPKECAPAARSRTPAYDRRHEHDALAEREPVSRPHV